MFLMVSALPQLRKKLKNNPKTFNPYSTYQQMCAMKEMLKSQKIKAIFTILNDKGLHTRPSTELVKCAANFNAHILLSYREHQVNAKSLLGILLLAAERGAKIAVEAEGPEASQAVEAIVKLASDRFYIKY